MNVWKIDMIHIRRGSKYDGMVERVTTAISDRITPDLRDTILQIKFEVPDGVMVPSIEIYYAVFDGGVRSYNQFEEWRKTHPLINSFEWIPKQGL